MTKLGHLPKYNAVAKVLAEIAKKPGQWWDESWNPVTGCTPSSPACKNCWAKEMTRRFPALHGGPGVPFSQIVLHPERLEAPLRWRKHRDIFVGSMTDLFHDDIPFPEVAKISNIIWQCTGSNPEYPEHTFFMLTKRPKRMKAFFEWEEYGDSPTLPENLWIGVTVEDKDQVWRIEKLLEIPGGHKFVCFEPLLGEIDVDHWLWEQVEPMKGCFDVIPRRNGIEWGIVGCESGSRRRPTDIAHIRKLRDQFVAAQVMFFLKQMDVNGRVERMPTLDGPVWRQMPGTSFFPF